MTISVDYRLAPEHKYPIAVEDAVESLDWVLKNGVSELGIDLSKIAVGGSSRQAHTANSRVIIDLKQWRKPSGHSGAQSRRDYSSHSNHLSTSDSPGN